MKISTRGRYALRIILDIAMHQDHGFVSMKDIARRQQHTDLGIGIALPQQEDRGEAATEPVIHPVGAVDAGIVDIQLSGKRAPRGNVTHLLLLLSALSALSRIRVSSARLASSGK